ncbi:hypothetical protein [Chryseobacterium sp. HSC-36S06]|uniref:hypothetical protein n=1 Tax=Chryseobacterium sp. HSC-36S06 TaxID=2910970 RepID=UPI00209F0A08|nr:hypothetical protein [Chryseobacterium sp. HSC-36S06]MCP2036964.1 integrase [Chryseobacterium sp. HSC-36S06]
MATFYYLRGTKEKKKIYISVTSGASFTVQRATKFSVNSSDWSQQYNRLENNKGRSALEKARQIEIDKFNTELLDYKNQVDNYLKELLEKEMLTENKIIEYIQSLNGKKRKSNDIPTDFDGFHDYYIQSKPWLAEGTRTVYNRTRNKINTIIPKLRMCDIDDDFKYKVASYFRENNYKMSYLRKTLGNVRDFWSYARDKGLTISIDPATWELTKEFPDLKDELFEDPYLSLAELDQIKAATLKKESLDNVRDWLIISCWTAQRVSDLMDFSTEKITEIGGEKFITIIQQKGIVKKELTIPLFKEVEAILNKRNGNFPRKISDQKYNDYVKEVCELAGLTELVHGAKSRQKVKVNGRTAYRKIVGYFPKCELISSHVGRRSFITNFLRQIDYEKIKQISGHKHSSMVDLYDKLESLKKAELLRNDFKSVGIE